MGNIFKKFFTIKKTGMHFRFSRKRRITTNALSWESLVPLFVWANRDSSDETARIARQRALTAGSWW